MACEWTKEEDQILLDNYSLGALYVKQILPSRSIQSIYHRAGFLKAQRSTSKRFCRKCGCNLTSDNWFVSCYERKDYICKKCLVIVTKENKAKNPKLKKWGSVNTIHTNGNTYLVRKRHRPTSGTCELCGRIKQTVYHHYGTLEHGKEINGIWVCRYCHPFVELYDRGFAEKYEELKKKVLG